MIRELFAALNRKVKRWVEPELDRTVTQLRAANDSLERLVTEREQLLVERDQLRRKVDELLEENMKLKEQVALLEVGLRKQNASIDMLLGKQEKMQADIDSLYRELMKHR